MSLNAIRPSNLRGMSIEEFGVFIELSNKLFVNQKKFNYCLIDDQDIEVRDRILNEMSTSIKTSSIENLNEMKLKQIELSLSSQISPKSRRHSAQSSVKENARQYLIFDKLSKQPLQNNRKSI